MMQDYQYVTVNQVLEAIDSLIPNSYSREEKTRWLTTFDGQVREEIMGVREDEQPFLPYSPEDGNRELLIPQPYGMDVYLAFLENTMDHYNGDTARHNNSLDQLYGVYTSFSRWYNRHHCPTDRKRKFW